MVCIPSALVVLVIFAITDDVHAQLDVTSFEHKFFQALRWHHSAQNGLYMLRLLSQ